MYLNFYKQKLQDFQFHIPVANLAGLYRNQIEKFPKNSKTLKIDLNKQIEFKKRLENHHAKLLIGICWRSGTLSASRNSEYTSIFDWGPIFSIPNACFVNLQYGECEEEIQQAEEKFNAWLEGKSKEVASKRTLLSDAEDKIKAAAFAAEKAVNEQRIAEATPVVEVVEEETT